MSDTYILKRQRAARDLAALLSDIRAAYPHIAWKTRAVPDAAPTVDAKLQTVIDLYRAGATVEEIGERVGMVASSIHRYIYRARLRGAWPADLVRSVGRPKVSK